MLSATSCSNDDEIIQESGELVIRAVADVQTTRVGFDADGTFYWSDGDEIGVTLSAQEGLTKMVLTEGVGKGTATFRGNGRGDVMYAVYPYSSAHQISAGMLSYNFPSQYKYDKYDADFFSTEKGYGHSFNAPMWGKADNGTVTFKHLGGVFCIKVTQLPIDKSGYGKGKIVLKSDQRLSGSYMVSLDETVPVAQVEDGASEVSISFNKPDRPTSGVFYVPAPAGRYTNLKVFMDGEEIAYIPEYTLKRCGLKVISDAVTVKTVEEANQALKDGKKSIEIKNDTRIEKAELIVAGLKDKQESTHISFMGDVGEIILRQKSEESADNVYQKVYVSLNGKQQNSRMKIDLPNTTVTLSSIADNTRLSDVTSATSYNTLVIQNGMEINNLVVKYGNVRIIKGGIVHSIKRSAENTFSCRLFLDEGAQRPEIIGEGIEVCEGIANNGAVVTGGVNKITPIYADVTIMLNKDLMPAGYEFVTYGICYSMTNGAPTLSDNTVRNFYYAENPKYPGKEDPYNVLPEKCSYIINGVPGQKIYYRAYIEIDNMTVMYGDIKVTEALPEIVLETTETVDLGLSVNWCNANVGAANPTDEGNMYRYGEIEPYSDASLKYPYGHSNLGSITTDYILNKDHDAAYMTSDGKYRMPTEKELDELKNKCTWGNCKYNDVDGVLFIGPSGKYIFLPKHFSESVYGNPAGKYLVYWSSEYCSYSYPDPQAYCIFDGEVKLNSWQTTNGLYESTMWYAYKPYMVRGVQDK